MTVGETLAEARYRAGLTVEELGELTRIRSTVIRSIEQDDYAACGGDLYVRGYVRAIAGAVGLDAQPLIREYDQSRASARGYADAPGTAAADPAATSFDLPPAPSAGETTRFDLPPVPATPQAPAPAPGDTTRFDIPAAPAAPAAAEAPGDATRFDLPAVHRGQEAPPEDDSAGGLWDILPFTAEPEPGGYDSGPAGFESQPPAFGAQQAGYGTGPAAAGFHLGQGSPSDAESYGYVDEPAASMPALSADSGAPGAAFTPPAEQARPGSAGPGTPRTPPSGPAGTRPAGRPAQSRPAAGLARGGTGRPARQTGSFAALTQTGAIALARAKKWHWATGIVAVAAMVVAGVAGILVTGGRSTTSSAPPVNAPVPQSATSVTAGAAAASAKATASAKPTASARPTATQTAPPAAPLSTLSVHAAQAFGPNGLADGDNPDLARYAISSHAPQAWSTQWYATPQFGMLKHGTGLLLDLGRTETVTSVRLYLAQYRGLNLQLRAAAGLPADPEGIPVVATAADAGGTLRLTLRHPADARYLLVWFTQLPPDGQGHYQESVYRVVVTGRR